MVLVKHNLLTSAWLTRFLLNNVFAYTNLSYEFMPGHMKSLKDLILLYGIMLNLQAKKKMFSWIIFETQMQRRGSIICIFCWPNSTRNNRVTDFVALTKKRSGDLSNNTPQESVHGLVSIGKFDSMRQCFVRVEFSLWTKEIKLLHTKVICIIWLLLFEPKLRKVMIM